MDELTKVEEPKTEGAALVPPPASLVVLATNPTEMAGAQSQLIGWFSKKIELCKAELVDAEENLALAKSRKWRTQGWARRVLLSRQTVSYYEKAKAALEAGYFIVPDFPVEIIAIRTTLSRPRPNHVDSTWRSNQSKDQVTNSPVMGEGEYVSPQAMLTTDSYVKQLGNEKTEKHYTTQASDFLPPDFPYKLVKPKILNDTNKAMAHKIFDEICVVSKPVRAPDPIVVGRIKRRVSAASEKVITFMVAWWIDVGDL